MKILFDTLIKFCLCVSVIYLKSASATEPHRWSSYNNPIDEFGPESTESTEDHNVIIHSTPVLYSSPKINTVSVNNKLTESSSEETNEKKNMEYEEEVTSNLLRSEEEQKKIQKTGFCKYLRKHPKGKNFQIDNLTYEQKIQTLNSLIEKTIEVNELKLKTIIFDQNKKLNKNTINDSDTISKSFQDDLYTLGNLLGSYHNNLIEIGLGYYSHKFFRLYYNYCTPDENDSLDLWKSKNKIFMTSIRCFLDQFDSFQFSQYKFEIQNKSQNTLLKYFQVSCDHLIDLYKKRNGVRMVLCQNGYLPSDTKRDLVDFTNNYLLDFSFIKKKKSNEEKFSTIKINSFKKIEAFDTEIAKKGVLKTVLGESATTAANMGSALLTQGTNLATQGLSQGATSLYNYYYSPTTQTQQIVGENKEGEPAKKGWFGW